MTLDQAMADYDQTTHIYAQAVTALKKARIACKQALITYHQAREAHIQTGAIYNQARQAYELSQKEESGI